MIRELLTRLRFFATRKRTAASAADIDEELQYHLEQSVAAKIAKGLTPAEARREAVLEFGGVERAREQCHEQHPAWLLGTIGQDVRYAIRGFRKNPAFTATVIATLAIGMGATTAVFSVVDPILFRSLPYAHDDRLVSVGLVAPIIPQEFMLGGSYYDWRDHQKPFAAFTSETGVNACDLTEHDPAHLSCGNVEANFLPTLGVTPILGRNFLPEEDLPNGPKVALLSYGLWLTHYGRDPGIVNRLIDIDGSQRRVVGVLPRNFEMPTLEAADVLLPQALDEAKQRRSAPESVLYAFARLKPGVTMEQATAQLEPVFQYSLSLAPAAFRKEVHLRVRSIRDRQSHDVRLTAWVLLGAVFAVLFIACANVAGLFAARGGSREREFAVRSALGATSGRLARQVLTEALLLAAAGAAAGFVLAEILLRVFLAIAPAGIPYLEKTHLDLRIAVFTIGLSLLCGAGLGLVSALHRPSGNALAARSTRNPGNVFLRRSLVGGQIAISILLLFCATLLLRSFWKLQMQQLGMRTHGIVTASISLPPYRYSTARQQMEFFTSAEAALRRLPGVTALGISDTLPPGGTPDEQIFANIAVSGKLPHPGGTGGMVKWRWVTPEYFRALDIPLLRGDGFSEPQRSSSDQVIILSSLLASRLFGSENPIGQRIRPGPDRPWCTVVGVAADVKNAGLTDDAAPEFYRLRRNNPEDWGGAQGVIIVGSSLSAEALAPWIRSQIAAIDPTVPVVIETLNERVSKLADRPRFETALLGFFALTGLAMAVIGLYGVTSFVVARRTQEIGVRMALGATRANILRLILVEGMGLVATGGALGLLVALAASRMLKSLLFGIGPDDPASLAIVALLLGLVAVAASLIPARAATRVEPVVALRYE